MNMGPGASATAANQTNSLPPFHGITFVDQTFLEMTVPCPKPIAMIKHYISASTLSITLNQDSTTGGSLNFRSHPASDVHPSMISWFTIDRINPFPKF